MLTCRDFSWLMSKELDTKLSFSTRIRVRVHMVLCRACYRYRKQLELIHSVVQKFAPEYDTLATPEESAGLPEESKERIKSFLKKHA